MTIAVRPYHGVRGEYLRHHNEYSVWRYYFEKSSLFGTQKMDWLPVQVRRVAEAAAQTGWYDRIVVLYDYKKERGIVLSEQDPDTRPGAVRTTWERTLLCQWAPTEGDILTAAAAYERHAEWLQASAENAAAAAQRTIRWEIASVLALLLILNLIWPPAKEWWVLLTLAGWFSLVAYAIGGWSKPWITVFFSGGDERIALEHFQDRHFKPYQNNG